MLDLVAKKLFLTKGIGVHEDKLTSFEYALRDAGIEGTNIVLISSIFPPKAKLIPRKEGLKLIKPGSATQAFSISADLGRALTNRSAMVAGEVFIALASFKAILVE